MSCSLCSSTRFEPVSKIDAKSGDKLNVSLCLTCGLIQQVPIPTLEELKIYYSHNYRLEYKDAYEPKIRHVHRAGKAAIDRLKFLEANGVIGGSLLDVGSGGGEFVYLSTKAGFDSYGIEPSVGYSEYANTEYGIQVATGELYDVTGSYDLITMIHVLEHLSSPLKAFEFMYHRLNENGLVFIEVPWIEAADASPNNIFFRAHLYYFSRYSLLAFATPYFECEVLDTSSNLRALFKKRTEPRDMSLPSTESVGIVRQRLHEKGWTEYLLRGRGLLKPVGKIRRAITERMLGRMRAKEVLDEIYTAAIER